MKAILWKEFRENLKWGVLLLLMSAFGIIYLQQRLAHQIVLFSEEYMIQAAFGFAAGALALGLLQSVFEGSRDRWAFLMHRGVSPERILAAKATVGLTYIVAAAAIPLIGMTWWCSRPGNVPAPFHPIAPLTGVIGIFAAFPAWFAGVLIGLRDVRWYGSRVLPLGLALLPVLCVLVSAQNWQVSYMLWTIPLSLLVTAIYAAAAVGVVQHRGGYLGQSRPTRWCLALTTTCGSLILLIAGATITVEGAREFGLTPLQDVNSKIYGIAVDGDVVRIEVDGSSRRLIDPATGEEVEASLVGPYSLFFGHLNRGLAIARKNPSPRLEYGQYAEGSIRLSSVRVGNSNSWWHYLPQEGILVNYSTGVGPVRIRRISPDGVLDDGEPVKRRFTGHAYEPLKSLNLNVQQHTIRPPGVAHVEQGFVNWTNILAFEDGIYSMDAGNLQVHQVYSAPADNPLLQFAPCSTESAVWLLHRETARKVVLTEFVDGKPTALPRDASGRLTITVDLPGYEIRYPDAIPDTGVEMFDLPEIEQVAYRWMDPRANHMGNFHQCVVLATRDGEIVKQVVHDGPVYEGSSDLYIASVYPPVLLKAGMRLFPGSADAPPIMGVPTNYFVTPPSYAFEIVMCLSTLFTVVVMVLIAKRASQTNASILRWSLGIVVFGPAALVTLLALRERPRRVKCVDCGRRRPISATGCPHCSQPFPKPETDGTEILLPLAGAPDPASTDIVPTAGV